MVNPNKYVRRALFEAIKNDYPCFDTQVTGDSNPNQYVLISTQDKEIDKNTKCSYQWISYTLLDLVCIYNGAGNVGSRLANDQMEDTIMALIENIEVEGFTVKNRRYEFPSNINTTTSTQSVFRSFIRVILTLE
jgi:hypothetical protein